MNASPPCGENTTVVVPTRNRPRQLAAALRSLATQTEAPAVVVVVDDGSTPPVELTDWSGPGRLLLLRRDDRHGEGATRNTGLAAVRTEWVAWCDDDDLWAPWKLAEQFAAIRRHPDSDWCIGEAAVSDGRTITGYVGLGEMAAPGVEFERLLLCSNSIGAPMSNLLARTSTIREVGAFDEELPVFTDWDLLIRLSAHGPPALVHRPVAVYRRHGGQMTVDLDNGPRVVADMRHRYGDRRARHGIGPGDDRVALWLAARQARRSPRAAVRSLRTAPLVESPADLVRLLASIRRSAEDRLLHRRSRRAARNDLAILAGIVATA
ncbi:MAG: glycosyltransferase [Acidimicrobiales bacterium]|nr:glycosyltransferase [Acidimicrobiales bacterium]